jgi:hypothetical protein
MDSPGFQALIRLNSYTVLPVKILQTKILLQRRQSVAARLLKVRVNEVTFIVRSSRTDGHCPGITSLTGFVNEISDRDRETACLLFRSILLLASKSMCNI